MNRKTEFGRNSMVLHGPSFDGRVWEKKPEGDRKSQPPEKATPPQSIPQEERERVAPPSRKRRRGSEEQQEAGPSIPKEDLRTQKGRLPDRKSQEEVGMADKVMNSSTGSKDRKSNQMELQRKRLRDWIKTGQNKPK